MWITIIWSILAGICLLLAGIYLLVWLRERDAWESLLFSISSAAAAVLALSEQALMHAQTAAEYGEILRWMHLPVAVLVVSLVWFLRIYLQSGRTWLVWLFCTVRVLVLVINFMQEPNFNFREITGLRQIASWGEMFSVPVGIRSPWAFLTRVADLLLLTFVADASIAAWRRGDGRRAFVIGGAMFLAVVLAGVFSVLMNRGILPGPFTTVVFMFIVFAMAGELSRDSLRTRLLSRDLRETQERMLLATDAAELGLWEWDIVRDEIWMNKVIRARLGAGEAERIGLNRFLQLLPPAEREQVRQAVQRSLDGGELEAEYRIITPDGDARWIAAQGRVQYGSDGKPHIVRGISIDITNRKETENALVKSEARLREAQKIAHMGNWELDLLTDTLTWSDEVFQIFEIEPADFGASYETFLSTVHPEDRDKVDSAYTQSLKNHEPCRIIHRLLMPEGRIKYVYEQWETLCDNDGKPLRLVGIVQDITESQEAANERIRLRNELAHLNRLMTMNELSVSLAHEINQPLGAILNNASAAQILNSELMHENTEFREILADIGNDAIRAAEVVSKIRAIVKKEEVKFERLNLNVLIESVVELYRNILNKEKISVFIDLQPDLAPVRGDQVRLQQVIMNLFANACEAMRESPAKALTIRSIMQSPDRITVSVSDSGSGVDDAVRNKVFQPFFTTKKDGLGMGLRISRTIIEDHGGRIWVENNPTAGATFYISLNTDQGESQ